jgi:hypothetical protein
MSRYGIDFDNNGVDYRKKTIHYRETCPRDLGFSNLLMSDDNFSFYLTGHSLADGRAEYNEKKRRRS